MHLRQLGRRLVPVGARRLVERQLDRNSSASVTHDDTRWTAETMSDYVRANWREKKTLCDGLGTTCVQSALNVSVSQCVRQST